MTTKGNPQEVDSEIAPQSGRASPPGGLTTDEARARLEQYGPNRLPEAPLPGPMAIFLRQFLSPFIYILLIAAVVSLVLGQLPNAIFILAVLLLNAGIGTVQEYSAQQSAAALREMVRGEARVIRDGAPCRIDAEMLVPGDLILLSSGDRVPADIDLYTSFSLAIDESLLTGESTAVTKNAQADVAADAPLPERVNRCFAGTIVTHGRGRGTVTATGLETELGRIAHRVTGERISEPPLMIRIRQFTYQVAVGILCGIAILVGIMLLRGGYGGEGMAMMAIGLAVSTIPEGLPAALTVALAIGMRRMANRNVIIRKLVAVESLGSCTFICSDKTGTLTVNELTIREAILPNGSVYKITGEGVSPGGDIIGEHLESLRALCITGLLANESHLDYSGGEWVSDGDIVDVAFLVFAKKLGLSLSEQRNNHHQLDLIPYESERAFGGSLNLEADEPHLYIKGSPEKLLSMCDWMDGTNGREPIDRAGIEAQFEALASRGFRVLALAHRIAADGSAIDQLDQMTFLGMVGMIDPVRPEAKYAIARCRSGGIDVAMITGDHPSTARAIALELNLCSAADPIVTGPMIRDAVGRGEAEVDRLVRSARVFARIEPTQKETVVDSLMRQGHFVAVTGDGVNDAPAMRRSNTGVAMGKRGTDVAKEAADLIITDDNFASIVNGIDQGRIVYNNIRKVIALLIATGFSALLLFFCTAIAGLPMPMTAVQLLWLNLVANGLQDVALAFEPKEGGELKRPPRSPHEPVFESHIIQHVLVTGTVMGALAFSVYAFLMNSGTPIEQARNLTLMLMVLFGNIHALSSRSESRSLFSMPFFGNPFLVIAVPVAQGIHIAAMYLPGISKVLELNPVTIRQWLMLAGVALILLLTEEVHKWWIRRARPGSPPPSADMDPTGGQRQADFVNR